MRAEKWRKTNWWSPLGADTVYTLNNGSSFSWSLKIRIAMRVSDSLPHRMVLAFLYFHSVSVCDSHFHQYSVCIDLLLSVILYSMLDVDIQLASNQDQMCLDNWLWHDVIRYAHFKRDFPVTSRRKRHKGKWCFWLNESGARLGIQQ